MRNTRNRPRDLFAYAHDNRASIVYIAVNTVNGKRYIGLTRVGLAKRRKTHLMNARRDHGHHNQYFYAALRKYGEYAFVFSELSHHASYVEACAAERNAIAALRPEYNLTAGGEGVIGHRHNEETRQKMSARAKARNAPWPKGACPEEVREKLAASGRARKGTYSAELRARIGQAHVGRKNDRDSRAVYCDSDGLSFRNIQAASKHYNVNAQTMANWCVAAERTPKRGMRTKTFWYVDEMYEL